MHTYKALRELGRLADELALEYIGKTAKGHHRWRHRLTGQTVITVSNIQHHRALDNTRRTIKRMLGMANA